ncbi:subunits of heterodimeric actin filament capping protein Capz [Rhizoclosmatium globosum]|uniref:F-actin-capping protein subunit alpha n=1 Tax=Rhizoclosmatium globosum TaxID=329046 RepID=A0A1Y2D0M7_9FUNG|nr:subunits of heterodimeric actin filament capping protein Capz [Rhizoclosmatium globosum]|eukprot:ORY52684.1 subunits of heterodimeric actin filament capping protein Capz [Rhizoclosmatium globosum]
MAYVADTTETLSTIAQFVSEAPPGELSEVLNDLRGLVANDELLQTGIAKPFEDYSSAALISVDVPGGKVCCLNNCAVRVVHSQPANTIHSSSSQTSTKTRRSIRESCAENIVAVDHVAQTASDPQPFEVDAELEDHRAALDAAIASYAQDHYPNGISAVYSIENKSLVALIVSNKFNPNNFWNGRWISEWTVSLDSDEVKGELKAHVHYYEDGNVQLKTGKSINAKLIGGIQSKCLEDCELLRDRAYDRI